MDLTQVMAVRMRLLPRHEMGIPGSSSQFAVQRLRKFQTDKGTVLGNPQ